MIILIHQVYVSNYGFNSIINKDTSTDVRTFVLDSNIIAGDFVIFINRENKKRTIVKVTDSEKRFRNNLIENNETRSVDKKAIFRYLFETYKDNIRALTSYNIEFEQSVFQVEFPIQNEKYVSVSEAIFLFVSEDGIALKQTENTYSFYRATIDKSTEMERIKSEALNFFGLSEKETIIPLMKYSMGKSRKEIYGQVFLVQPEKMQDAENIKVFRPNNPSSLKMNDKLKMLAETLNFDREIDRYFFWVIETLFINDDIPENEIGYIDEPETIADILCNRIKCLHDLLYLDYNTFVGDNFRIYVEPHLTDSQCFERTTRLAFTERNYQEILNELIYNPAFAEWALDYDRERTIHDERYAKEWLT